MATRIDGELERGEAETTCTRGSCGEGEGDKLLVRRESVGVTH